MRCVLVVECTSIFLDACTPCLHLAQIMFCPPIQWKLSLDIIDHACNQKHHDAFQQDEWYQAPPQFRDLRCCCGQQCSRACRRMKSLRKAHDGRGCSHSESSSQPSEVLKVV